MNAWANVKLCFKSVLRGHYKIGVLGKGGVGKTTVSVSVGSVFAELRQDDRVVAIDADTAFGKLGSRVDPKAVGSYWEMASDQNLESFADVHNRMGNNSAGLYVLAGEAAPARRRVLDPAIYREATRGWTGTSPSRSSTAARPWTHPSPRRCCGTRRADRRLLTVGGRRGGGRPDDGLVGRPRADRTVAAHRRGPQRLGWACRQADQVDTGAAVRRPGSGGRRGAFDGHLRPGGVIDRTNVMSPLTRRRFIEIAAALAEHFPSSDDWSRERY